MKQLLKLFTQNKRKKLHGQPRTDQSGAGMRGEFNKIIHLKQGVISMPVGR